MKNKSNEFVVKDPEPDYVRSILTAGAEALHAARGNSANRTIDPMECVEAAAEVTDTAFGCRVIWGGSKASSYPASTAVIIVGWHTRISGVKVVRVVLLVVKIAGPCDTYAIRRRVLGPALAELGEAAGPLVCSTVLRELWEFSDVACGDTLDPLRQCVRVNPADMQGWANLALAMETDSGAFNSRQPGVPVELADAIRERVL